ncbi:MAG: bifunctional hydroxymethylpyrimidine kinase/phosphomethylpyrimidine kinase [Candidatus Methanomethyliaceae archaeon]|nr:bifunctional hydroxymethylpyrimidine kinase/phosphomethylpyrimidine kinase [Candidatus Methanomethyliaceae archaeon]
MKPKIPTVLTIAGSDSGGGAGIEADLKTFASIGVHGLVALTAVTAQNTTGVIGVHELPPEMVHLQIEAVVKDIGVDFAKTGMLSSSTIIREVAKSIKKFGLKVVVDPVMVAKSGAPLLRSDAVLSLKEELIPLAEVVTPNLDEAEVLTGMKIETVEDSVKAGKYLIGLGPKAVVVKGGHLKGDAVDVLCMNDGTVKEFRSPRVDSPTTHGTGCTFSSAIAAYLALGLSLEDSVREAKNFVLNAILYGLRIGKGVGPVDPMSNLRIDAERYRVLARMQDALSMLESLDSLAQLVPECQINLVMALPHPYAKGVEAVCGVPGRITNVGGRLRATSCPTFGASKHVANVVLTVMQYDPTMRSAMNIRYSKEIISACERLGWVAGYYDRTKEPPEIKEKEGATIPWGVREAIKSAGRIPEIIYHTGDHGKEPMVIILGKDPVEVVMRALKLSKSL